MRSWIRPWLAPAALTWLAACSGMCGSGESAESGEAGETRGESSWYRASIEGELGQTPFYVRIPGPGEDGDAEIRNGSASLPVEHRWEGEHVVLDFSHWGTTIEAERLDSGELEGVWVASPIFQQFEAPFAAEPVEGPDPGALFPGDEPAEVEVDGTWRADFPQSGTGEFRLRTVAPGAVEGTVVQRELSGGDFGNVAGNVRGDALYLATFDGQKAFRLNGRVGSSGQMVGKWEFVGLWEESFRAVQGELEETLARISVGDHNRHIDVRGLGDPRYEGKPVIVLIFGTWCTNCGDLSPVIRDLYERYHGDGLEVHAVAYEVVEDEEYIEQQIATYRERYDATWPIVPVPGEVETRLPPELQGIGVVPMTLFRNPDGTMHAIRAGFVSPASGEVHDEQVAEFERLTKEIMDATS